jgi:hypothetical protein
MKQDRDDETTGQELFMEELGQVHGGQMPPIDLDLTRRPSLATYEAETGYKESRPYYPRETFVTQMLGEGYTPPVPKV